MDKFFLGIGMLSTCVVIGTAITAAIWQFIGLVADVRALQEGSGDKARDFDVRALAKRTDMLESRADVFNTFITDLMTRVEAIEESATELTTEVKCKSNTSFANILDNRIAALEARE
jgi:hypothetical protein